MNTSQRIKTISDFYKINRYLEVGVEKGVTFNSLEFEYKTGVDPVFKFNTSDIQSDSIKLYEMTSDDYFTKVHDNEKFDLIFLDGLHTFDQTLRDLNNALLCSHDSTIIIIDDVYPSDVFSSLRKNAVKERKAYDPNSTSMAWHGDVYKAILIVHDYYPKLSFVTIDRGFGNPQSIIYKSRREGFKPFFNSIEAIERLSYFDFMEHRSLLNLRTEADALMIVKNHLSTLR